MSGAVRLLLAIAAATGRILGIANGSGASPATLVIGNTGTYTIPSGTSNWVAPASAVIAGFWEFKVDATSGSFSSGTTGTWIAGSTGATYTKSGGTVTFTVTWRDKASQQVQLTQTGLTLQGL